MVGEVLLYVEVEVSVVVEGESYIVVELFVFAFRMPFPSAISGVCEFFNSFGHVRESMRLRFLTSVDDGIGLGH